MNATLILRNGQRIEVKGISQEYLERLMNFNILAGYIVKSVWPWVMVEEWRS